MRCFIAIELTDSVREEIRELSRQLKDLVEAKSADIKWVKPESIHITLKFLGEVSDKKIAKVCDVVKSIVSEYKSFHIDFSEVGTFGDPARVIWLGVKDEDNILNDIVTELDDKLTELGYPHEGKKFAPHLTLCRITSARAGRNAQAVVEEHWDYEGPAMAVDSVCVFQSELSDKGAQYTAVSRIKLK